MNILYVVPSLRNGGAETLVTNYAVYLKENYPEHNVKILSLSKRNEEFKNDKKITEQQIPVMYVNNAIRKNKFFHYFDAIRYRMNILKVIKNMETDIIHFHLTKFEIVFLILFVQKKPIYKYTIHSTIDFAIVGKLQRFFAKLCSKNKKFGFIALHLGMKKELLKLMPNAKVDIIYNGIDLKKFLDESNCKSVNRLKLGISADKFVVGHIGTFWKVKNHEFLMSVFREILKDNKDSMLLLVGDGELKKDILEKNRDLIENNFLTVYENREDIPQIMSVMDVFVLPSFLEGFPTVAIEAQAAGCPCVLADTITKEIAISENVTFLNLEKGEQKNAKKRICKLHTPCSSSFYSSS